MGGRRGEGRLEPLHRTERTVSQPERASHCEVRGSPRIARPGGPEDSGGNRHRGLPVTQPEPRSGRPVRVAASRVGTVASPHTPTCALDWLGGDTPRTVYMESPDAKLKPGLARRPRTGLSQGTRPAAPNWPPIEARKLALPTTSSSRPRTYRPTGRVGGCAAAVTGPLLPRGYPRNGVYPERPTRNGAAVVAPPRYEEGVVDASCAVSW